MASGIPNAFPAPFDITDPGAGAAAMGAIVARHGRLDCLVNNAAVRDRRPLEEIAAEDFRRLIETNLVAQYELARVAARHMAASSRPFTKLYLPDKPRSPGTGRLSLDRDAPTRSRERRSAMSDTTETPQPSSTPTDRSRRRFFRPAAIVAVIVIVGLATGIGLKALAYGHGFGGWHRGGFMSGPIDPARLDEHLDRMLKHLYVEVDATDAQKQQLAPIVKGAVRDLLPMRERMRDARMQAVALLSQPTVDRAALEALRANQLKLAEQASRRVTQALADAADVLTPEQRKALADRIGRWHGGRG